MASQQPVSDNDPLRQPSRYITDHDAEGNAIFADLPEVVPLEPLGNLAWNVSYTTFETPVKFTDQKDKITYLTTPTPESHCVKNGSVLNVIDIAPGHTSPNHRTESLDYGILVEGEVELTLEDVEKGPRRVIRRGDVVVQRGTMHAWHNPSKTEWARMVCVVIDAEPLQIGNKRLGEEYR